MATNKQNELVEEEKKKQEAEIRMLQAQIKPHFLYNALDNIRSDTDRLQFYIAQRQFSLRFPRKRTDLLRLPDLQKAAFLCYDAK